MASLNLSQDELKAIESTRSRLFQLSNSIASVKNDMFMSQPLPSAASLQASTFILQQNMASLLQITNQHADLFQRIALHPSTNFPGRQHENILQQLLRKKLEPDVEGSVERARETAAAAGIGAGSFVVRDATAAAGRGGGGRGGYDSDDDDSYDGGSDDDEDEGGPLEPLGLGDVWADAQAWCAERVRRFVTEESDDLYTREERERGIENVRTGLRRDLEDEDESDEEDDEDEDAEMGGVTAAAAAAAPVPPPPPVGVEPEVMLWCAARGDVNVPAYLEYESRRKPTTNKQNR